MSCERPLHCEDGTCVMKTSGSSVASSAIADVNSSASMSALLRMASSAMSDVNSFSSRSAATLMASSATMCVRKGEKTRIFVHTLCFGQFFDQSSENPEKLYKCGFSGNCPKPKMPPFFEKGVFLTCVKK